MYSRNDDEHSVSHYGRDSTYIRFRHCKGNDGEILWAVSTLASSVRLANKGIAYRVSNSGSHHPFRLGTLPTLG